MQKIKHTRQVKGKKKQVNMYAWGQKNKKKLAGIICIILVVGLLAGLLQM